MKEKVTNEDVYAWLGDDIHDIDNLIVLIGDVANGDYPSNVLLSDILEYVRDREASDQDGQD